MADFLTGFVQAFTDEDTAVKALGILEGAFPNNENYIVNHCHQWQYKSVDGDQITKDLVGDANDEFAFLVISHPKK